MPCSASMRGSERLVLPEKYTKVWFSAMGGVSTTRLSHFPKLYLRQVDLSLAEAAARAAARFSLRGADSHYVALSRELKCPLITNDDEVIQRCPPTMKVLRPDKWLDLQPDR